jgi:pimeloyl-ACP methyl ester carboxylesterase
VPLPLTTALELGLNEVAFVLLPGLDGTGRLMQEFVEALGPEAEVQVVSYPPDRVLGYAELVEFVRDALPLNRSYLLVAESFSGPVGCALAATRPKGLVGLVLCASFASTPFPALRRLSFLLRFAPAHAVPAAALAILLLGRWSSPHSLRHLVPRFVRSRLRCFVGALKLPSLPLPLSHWARSRFPSSICVRPQIAWFPGPPRGACSTPFRPLRSPPSRVHIFFCRRFHQHALRPSNRLHAQSRRVSNYVVKRTAGRGYRVS